MRELRGYRPDSAGSAVAEVLRCEVRPTNPETHAPQTNTGCLTRSGWRAARRLGVLQGAAAAASRPRQPPTIRAPTTRRGYPAGAPALSRCRAHVVEFRESH